MNTALSDLNLRHLFVINPGDATFPLTKQITALGLDALGSLRRLTS
jgi:hypothetical protein